MLIPANLVGELKGLPEDVLSASEAVSEVGCRHGVPGKSKT